MEQQWKVNVLGLLSIALSVLTFITKEDRLVTSLIFSGAIIFYIIDSFSDTIDKVDERLKKVEEKLRIHDQLVGITADIQYLKNVVQNFGRRGERR